MTDRLVAAVDAGRPGGSSLARPGLSSNMLAPPDPRWEDASDWIGQRLPNILLPGTGGALAVLEAYFDESERTSGIFCVAGYVFERASAKKFDREWRTLMKPVWPFHMVDLTSGNVRFRNVARKERDRILKAAVALINQRMSLGVSVSCRLEEVRSAAPTWIRGFGHPYTLCCHLAMMSVGQRIADAGRADRVAYVFETGHKGRTEAQDFMRGASQAMESLEAYRHVSHAFVPKTDSSHLQAADLLAWEWAKCYDETFEMGLRPARRSIRALLEGQSHRYKAVHLTGAPLRRFMTEIESMGLEQLRESSRAE
jgi:hypothetical protein